MSKLDGGTADRPHYDCKDCRLFYIYECGVIEYWERHDGFGCSCTIRMEGHRMNKKVVLTREGIYCGGKGLYCVPYCDPTKELLELHDMYLVLQ
jgi:hypothetical protein